MGHCGISRYEFSKFMIDGVFKLKLKFLWIKEETMRHLKYHNTT